MLTRRPRSALSATRLLLGLCGLLFGLLAQAQVAPAGTYGIQGGWGRLLLRPPTGGTQAFAIWATGANAHSCELEGKVGKGGVARLVEDGDRPCLVRFEPVGSGVKVSDASAGACSVYCGMRADFQGVYEVLPSGCHPAAVSKTRSQFSRQYKEKQFTEARATLQPLLATCGPWLHWSEAGRIRNDMAVTLHHLGEAEACRAVLQPLVADASRSDAQIREEWAPTDADVFLPIARATRHNLKLCGARSP
jgi:hypothetical protein